MTDKEKLQVYFDKLKSLELQENLIKDDKKATLEQIKNDGYNVKAIQDCLKENNLDNKQREKILREYQEKKLYADALNIQLSLDL